MKELKKIFAEIGHAYETLWRRKKHFIHITSVLLVSSIIPFVLFELVNISLNSGLVGINNIELLLYGTLFIVLVSVIATLLGAVGFVASIRSIIAHKREPLKKIFTRGAKKVFPAIWLGIVTILPLITFGAATIYFKLGNWGVALMVVGLLWAAVTYFSKFFLLFDDEKVHKSLHDGVVFFVKNVFDIILRVLAAFAAIIVPMLLITTLLETIHLLIVKAMFGIPTLVLAKSIIDSPVLPTSGVVVGIIFMIISMGVTLYIFLPLIVTYVVTVFDEMKEKTKESKKLERGVEKTTIVLYSFVTLLALVIFVNTFI